MNARWYRLRPGLGNVALDVGLCLAVLGLLALSYRSIEQWRRSSPVVAEQRANVTLTLLTLALYHDMRGTQLSALLPLEFQDVVQDPPYDLRDRFSRAFARFPYAESFFVLKEKADGTTTFDLFTRTDRPPPWAASPDEEWDYPTVLRRNPEAAGPLADAMRHTVASNRGAEFVVLEPVLGGTPYQVVAKVLRAPPGGDTIAGVVGFTVNLQWNREGYYHQLLDEVSRISDAAAFTSLAIVDGAGHRVAATRPFGTDDLVQERRFSPMFFDPALVSVHPVSELRPWTAMVGIAQDRMLIGGQLDARDAYVMLAVAAIASVVGILLTARAVRSHAALAAMQADFVCTVTHDLKTPLASIRLMAETLSRGGAVSRDTMTDYAQLLSEQAWRLTRQIDNVLTLARISNSGRQPEPETIEIAELVEDGLHHFRPQLEEKAFSVTVDIPPELPRVRGDRALLMQALDNMVDNAIKYSVDRHEIRISAGVEGRWLRLDVGDKGMGIAPTSVPYVFDKFYRGPSVPAGGSGLGLAIVRRIVDEHRGHVRVTSVPGEGTVVQLSLPLDRK